MHMTEADRKLLDDLLNQTNETSTIEFKREIHLFSDKDKHEFAKDVSAFANTSGGYIVYGKEDIKQGGRIIGINPKAFDADQLQQIIATRCYPPPKFSLRIIKRASKWFAILEIPESENKPHEITNTRDVWIRRGGITDKATQKERVEMAEKEKRRKSTLKEQLEIEGISEEPESGLRRGIIRFGRWYLLRTYGTLGVPLHKERALLAILSLVFFVPLVLTVIQISFTQVVPPTEILVVSVFFVVPGVFLLRILEILPKLRCPKCNRYFSIRRIEHTRVKDKTLSSTEDQIIREVTYRNTYRCEFCDYADTRFEIEKETIDTTRAQ